MILRQKWFRIIVFVLILYAGWCLINSVVNDFWKFNFLILGINIILAVSLNLINGYNGQFSLGHAGFMAVGGYTSAVITLYFSKPLMALFHFSAAMNPYFPIFLVFLLAILAGGIMAAIFGFIIGIPTLRLKGDYLAIATLGFGEIIRLSVLNVDYLGAATGMKGLPHYTNANWVFFLTVFTVLIIYNLINSSHGRAILSIREDEIAAETMGINTTRYKVIAFVVGSFFAGIAGALFAHNIRLVTPTSFTFIQSTFILVMVVLGGQGSTSGVIIGAAAFTVLNTFLADYPYERTIIFALLLIIMMLLRPEGLMGTKEIRIPFLSKKEGESFDTTASGKTE
jgi:branched-chain amino acid transport system permease protein